MYNKQLDEQILNFIKQYDYKIGNIFAYDKQQYEIFDFIIQKNLIESAKFLIQKDKKNINHIYSEDNKKGWTLLINALVNNREEIAIELINAGADINIKLESGHTALIIAFQNNLKNILEILIDRVNKEDLEFLLTIQDQSNKECIKIINNKLIEIAIEETKQITSKEQPTPEEIKVIEQYIKTQKLKHDDKVYKINIKSPYIYTLLEWACWKGYLEIVELLITEENINLKGTSNDVPLIFAFRSKNLDLIKFMIEQGADINLRYKDEKTPLTRALQFKNSNNIITY